MRGVNLGERAFLAEQVRMMMAAQVVYPVRGRVPAEPVTAGGTAGVMVPPDPETGDDRTTAPDTRPELVAPVRERV